MGSKVEKQDKAFTAEIKVTLAVTHYVEDSYDKSRSSVRNEYNELTTMTLKATSLKKLVEKINDHTTLLSED